jgi:hypothetical protein
MIVGLYGRLRSCMPTNAIDVNVQLAGFCDVELLLRAASCGSVEPIHTSCRVIGRTKMPSILPFWIT